MSFYGQVVYELTNAFSSLIVKNSGKLVSDFPESLDDSSVSAIGLESKIKLDSGNKWIGLVGDQENITCTVFHNPIDAQDHTNSFATISNVDPSSEIITLSPGDCLTGVNVTYDGAGHVTGSTPITYKLPLSQTEQDVEDIKERMDTIEQSDSDQTNQINGIKTDYNTIATSLNSTKSSLTTLSNRVGSMSDLSILSPNVTITKAIGNIDLLSTYTGQSSLASATIALSTTIKEQNAAINSVSLAQQTIMERLCAQLREKGIDIDEEALWQTETANS